MTIQTRATPQMTGQPKSAHSAGRPVPLAWPGVGLAGATTGLGLTFAYAGAFILYGVVRHGLAVQAAPPEVGLVATYLAGATSLAVASLGFAVLVSVPAAILGALLAWIVWGLVVACQARGLPRRGAASGAAAGLGLVLLVHGALLWAGLLSLAGLASSAYLFWLGAPSLLAVAASGLRGRQLALHLTTRGAVHT